MALKGNLRDFSITQLLNLINLARKTGTLSVEATNQQTRICFKEGKLVFASLGEQDGQLAQVLFKAGKLSQEQARTILAQGSSTGDKRLGMMLIQRGLVTQDDILQSVRKHIEDVIFRVFTWSEGMFRFEPNVLPPDERITVPINLENVIMEGTRRLKESEQLQDELPNLDMALRFTDRPDVQMRNINLSVEEWRVVSFINPRNSIRQIAKANNLSDLQIRRIIYGMLQAGLVEMVRPEGVELAPSAPAHARTRQAQAAAAGRRPPPVKRSVVEKLITRIKRL
jgi:hypothetical protein